MTTQHTPTPTTGFAWHLHHDVLLEWCFDYAWRVAVIKTDKPLEEQATRLRLFQMVKGQLPAKYDAAKAKYVAVRAEYVATTKAKFHAWEAKFDAAWAEYVAAWATYKPEILALHAQECPDCPWNGKTIFPKAGAA